MPSIDHLLDKLNKKDEVLVCVNSSDSIEYAFDKMLQHGFSQLPIIESDNTMSLITVESILKLLGNLGAKIKDAGAVSGARVKISQKFTLGQDLFDLMSEVEKTGSALIVDDNGNPINIITTFDTTRYFQEWSEDTMFVGDIEKTLKDIVTESFKSSDGVIDQVRRKKEVENAFSTSAVFREKFRAGLKQFFRIREHAENINKKAAALSFLELLNDGIPDEEVPVPDSIPLAERNRIRQASDYYSKFVKALQTYLSAAFADDQLDDKLVFDAISNGVKKDNDEVDFDQLTLGQYIQLFFRESWGKCGDALQLPLEQVEFMLDGVRKTRNNLAHFHEDAITAQQREQLRYCYNWLQDNRRVIYKSIQTVLQDAGPGKAE